MMMGACSPARADNTRLSAMYGYTSKGLWCTTRARMTVFRTIQPAMSPRNRKMKGHEPPKLAMLSATRSPTVRSSCTARRAGCMWLLGRDHGYQVLRRRSAIISSSMFESMLPPASERDLTAPVEPNPPSRSGGRRAHRDDADGAVLLEDPHLHFGDVGEAVFANRRLHLVGGHAVATKATLEQLSVLDDE